jgi:hypothetical protein
VIWRITPDGATWLASRALTALRDANNAQEARAHARDLGVAADRMVQFRVGTAPPADETLPGPRPAHARHQPLAWAAAAG